ncbi:hypothetical protein L596_002250 [Steinernema carpocapsae]|uniref:Uncharacterized protein n=1 Tax=Steinernema carpocapsae TaxID=34508 RepID=A0A4U8UQL9_STECR|nr:hypothetical protein L596_002250 [Steinernema carpocapsae]
MKAILACILPPCFQNQNPTSSPLLSIAGINEPPILTFNITHKLPKLVYTIIRNKVWMHVKYFHYCLRFSGLLL